MFGIKFVFHPNLRRFLQIIVLRTSVAKDFPLVGYVDIFYNDAIQAISTAP